MRWFFPIIFILLFIIGLAHAYTHEYMGVYALFSLVSVVVSLGLLKKEDNNGQDKID